MTAVISAFVAFMPLASSISQAGETEGDIDYQIMVQRATQAAIWAMPAVGIGAPSALRTARWLWKCHL